MRRLLITTIILLLGLIGKAEIVKTYAWEGRLGDKVDFRVDIAENEKGVICGYTTYYHPEKNYVIPMYGYCDRSKTGSKLTLTEFDKKRQCGMIEISLSGQTFKSGFWALGYEHLEMKSVKASKFDSEKTYFQPLSGKSAKGSYSFYFETEKGAEPYFTGSCDIKRNGENSVKWEMEQMTPNFANGEGISQINGSYFSDELSDRGANGKYSYCFKFWAYVDKRFVLVHCENPNDDWGFGHGATLAGVYVK